MQWYSIIIHSIGFRTIEEQAAMLVCHEDLRIWHIFLTSILVVPNQVPDSQLATSFHRCLSHIRF